MVFFFAKVKLFIFWPKTMDYSQAFWPKLSSIFAVLLLEGAMKLKFAMPQGKMIVNTHYSNLTTY